MAARLHAGRAECFLQLGQKREATADSKAVVHYRPSESTGDWKRYQGSLASGFRTLDPASQMTTGSLKHSPWTCSRALLKHHMKTSGL